MSLDDALLELKSQLNKLVDNNKNQIQLLTLLADDYSEHAEQLTDAICKHIYELPPDKKLLGIYVMDSILKFADKKENYRRLFGRQVVDVFVDTFQKVPITKRTQLYKVRATWQQTVFPKSKLFDLDVRVQQHDPSWPIWAEKKSSSSNQASTSTTTNSKNGNDKKVVTDERERRKDVEKHGPPSSTTNLEGKKDVEKEKSSEKLKKDEPKEKVQIPPRKTTDESKPSITVIGSNPLRDPRRRAQNSVSSSPKKDVVPPAKVPEKATPPKNVDVPSKPHVPAAAHNVPQKPGPMIVIPPPQFLPTIPKPSSQTNVAANVRPPAPTTKPSEAPNSNAVVGANQLTKKLDELVPKKKDETFKLKEVKQEPMEVDKNLQQNMDFEKDKRKKNKKRSKHEDGRRHRSPDRIGEKKRRIETENHIKPTIAPGSHAFLPNTNLNINTIPMIPTTMSGISPLGTGIKMEIDDSWRKPISTVITNETPKIGSNANNRIFVDGRAYEVHYINDVAVIEQNGLPHRIYFQGPTRRIQIDDKTYELDFEKTITIPIDNEMHDIRFGAPSRELYVGNYPFRGAFGGPPMIANINGKRHEFRLLGAPPEVRIDKDPCYELYRHMQTIRQPQSSIEGMNKGDLSSFLKSLKDKGILAPKTTSESATEKTKQHVMKGSEKPVIGAALGTVRMDCAPQALKDFAMSALVVRYTDLVDMLHRDRPSCTHCGISFPDTKSEAYLQHIDNHVQDLLRSKDTKAAKYQTLYMNYDEWLEYDELSEVLKISTQESTKSHPFNEEESISTTNTIGSPSDPIASTNLNKFCVVCHEKFNEYYDNEEDEWRFQDCVVRNNQAIHRDCLEQFGDVEMEDETLKSSNNGLDLVV